ncbi:MAG: endonuclease [Gemmatimonadota bacterium]|nr:endonuclease [Gemmatimonadota bacterium]
MAKRSAASSGRKDAPIYSAVIEKVFLKNARAGAKEVLVTRKQLEQAAAALEVDPKNVGDILYSFRYRRPLPDRIRQKAPKGHVWIIRGGGAAQYRFCAVPESYAFIRPNPGLMETRVPDSTPGIIARYALDDEQALLAKVRYNRLVDIFTGVACYSLQSHLRTQVTGLGQIETDEVYVGIDRQGAHYVIPVQAKGGSDKHSIVQIEQDFAMAKVKFPASICRPIAAQFIGADKIALFAFGLGKNGDARVLGEKHYVLVDPQAITAEELETYRREALLPG